MIKLMFKLLLLLVLLAGWVLAALAVHVVRRPGPIPKVGMIQIIPKDSLSFKETWLDMTHWTKTEMNQHELLVKRLEKDEQQWIKDLTKEVEKKVAHLEK
jgi:hypothetical protein